MTPALPWTDLTAAPLPQLIAEPPSVLLLTDPQRENAHSLASALSRAMQCTGSGSGTKPCGGCKQCKLSAPREDSTTGHPDILYHTQPLSTSDVRQLTQHLWLTPSVSPIRTIYLGSIDRYHNAAANALLKTLEEPPLYNRFILSAPARRAVKPTILSRAQVYAVPQPDAAQAQTWLAASGMAEEQAARLLPIFRGNPHQAKDWQNLPYPLGIMQGLAWFSAYPKQNGRFLDDLENYLPRNPQNPQQTLDLLLINLEHLILARQLDTSPQTWHNLGLSEELITAIDPNKLHSLHAALSALRRPERKQIGMAVNIKSLLLTHLDTRNPRL